MLLELKDLRGGYVEVARAVLRKGDQVAPRGLVTREVLDAVLVVEDPSDLLPVGTGRKVATGLAALEALQLVGGYSDPAQLRRASRNMAQFEDLGQYHGAYGPRVRPQLSAAVDRIREDPSTRRAVVSVWDPLRDLFVHGMRNYPCTTELQFLVRRDRLILQVTMRANDVWHGLAYDAFVFGQLQHTVANALGVEPGPYRHHARSLHLYQEHWASVEDLHESDAPALAAPAGFSVPSHAAGDRDAVEWAARRARHVGQGLALDDPTPSEAWYEEKVARYVAPITEGEPK